VDKANHQGGKTMTVKELFHQSKTLKPIEKAQLVDLILADLDKPDLDVENAWLKEIQRRKQNLKNGRTKALSYQTVMGKYK
jgi:Putative addiction module component